MSEQQKTIISGLNATLDIKQARITTMKAELAEAKERLAYYGRDAVELRDLINDTDAENTLLKEEIKQLRQLKE